MLCYQTHKKAKTMNVQEKGLTLHEEVESNTTVHEVADTVSSSVHFVWTFFVILQQRDLKVERYITVSVINLKAMIIEKFVDDFTKMRL